MKGIFQSVFISVGLACFVHFAMKWVGSSYILDFLRSNLINIQIGLLAINTATLGVVLTKLRDLVDSGIPLSSFSRTRKEMLISIREQVALIAASLVLLSISDATAMPFSIPADFLQILLVACFAYSLLILYDTAKSVFVLLESPQG